MFEDLFDQKEELKNLKLELEQLKFEMADLVGYANTQARKISKIMILMHEAKIAFDLFEEKLPKEDFKKYSDEAEKRFVKWAASDAAKQYEVDFTAKPKVTAKVTP
jgi:hypothetical protein